MPGTVTVRRDVAAATTGVTWSDTTITGTVNPAGVANCTVQQKNAPASKCGELVITAANGKQSIDADHRDDRRFGSRGWLRPRTC